MSSGDAGTPTPRQDAPSDTRASDRPLSHVVVARIRGSANVALLLGAIVLLFAFAMHWPPRVVAPFGLFTLAAFLVSFVAILIENRLPGPDDGGEP